MFTFNVDVKREGRKWLIEVPAIGQVAHALRIIEIDDVARRVIAASTGASMRDIAVRVAYLPPSELGGSSLKVAGA